MVGSKKSTRLSMNYSVRIPDTIKSKITSLIPSVAVRKAFYQQLREDLKHLPPDELGNRIVAPVRCVCREIKFSYDDERASVWVWINDTKFPNTRSVTAVSLT
jgi:hypothetical protein